MLICWWRWVVRHFLLALGLGLMSVFESCCIGAFVSTAAAFAVWVVFHRAVFFRILARLLLLFCDWICAVKDVSLWIARLAKAYLYSPIVRLIMCFLFRTNSASRSPCFPLSKSVGPIFWIKILAIWQSRKHCNKSPAWRKLIFRAPWCVWYCVSCFEPIVHLILLAFLFPNPSAPSSESKY